MVSVSFAGSTLTLANPDAADNLRVVSSFTRVGSTIVPSTDVFAGAGGDVLVATLTSATNANTDTITITGGAATNSLTVIGNGPTLTTINLGAVDTLSVRGSVPVPGNLQVNATGGIEFGTTTIEGNLSVDASGAITQTPGTTLVVTGTADIDVTGFDITLTNNNLAGVPRNSFGTLVLDGAAISIREGNPTVLGTTTATGVLTVFSTASVTSSSVINVTGASTNINVGKGGNITLTNTGNVFSTLNLGGANITVVEAAGSPIDLGNITASGNLNVTSAAAGNTITNSGATLNVGGRARFTTAGATVNLSAGTVNFGSVLVVAPAAAVTIDEDSATSFANLLTSNPTTVTSTSAASLSVTSAGAITDTGSLTVTGATTLLANGGASAIALDSPTNNFGGTVRFVGSNVTLVDGVGGIALGSVAGASTANRLTVTATRTAGGAVAPVTDTAGATVTIAGKAEINAIGSGPTDYQAITLDDGTWGGLALRASTAAITEAGGTDLLNCTITGATFSVTATTGNITNGIAPLPGGKQGYHNINAGAAAVSFTTQAAGADITILNAAQVISTFGTLSVDTTGPNGDASISEGFGTVLNVIDVEGNFTLNAIDGRPTPPTTNLRSVTQSVGGTIDVDGLTTINASPSFEVTLLNAGNDFGTGLGVSGRNVSIDDDDAGGVALDRSTIAGNFSLNSAGPITQAASGTFGRLKVVGTTTLTGTSIVLDRRDPVSALAGAPFENASNTFGNLILTSPGAVTIIEKGATTLGTSTVGTAGGADEVFIIVSTGAITDVGVITANGEDTTMTSIAYATSVAAPALAALLTATPTGTISLDSTDGAFVPLPTNNFIGEINLRGTNVVLKDVGSTELGAILATGTLTVTSTGTVTNPTELVSVGRLATFIKSGAAAADLTLGTTLAASLGSLTAVGQTAAVSFTNVTLDESDSTSLSTMRVGGNLDIGSGGAVTDTGVITVTGTTTISTNSDITLDSSANNFVGDFTFQGAAGAGTFADDVFLVDSTGGIEFATSNANTLTVKATNGAVTDDAAATLTIGVAGVGNVTIKALGTGNNITLDSATNLYNILNLQGGSINVDDDATLTLGNVTATGTLTLRADDDIAQAAGSKIVVTNESTLTTINVDGADVTDDVILTNTGNRFGRLRIGTLGPIGGNVNVVEGAVITLGLVDINGTLSLTATGNIPTTTAGAISQDASVMTVDGATTLTAVDKDITLNTGTNSFGSLTVTGKNVSITEDNDAVAGTTIGGTVKGNLTLTAAGAVTNNGALLVSGSATIATPSTVNLSTVTNEFGSINVTGATSVTIFETGDTKLGIITPSVTLSVTSTGNIVDTGVDATSTITVAGGLTTLVAGGSITLDDDDNNFSTVDFSSAGNVTLNDSVADLVLAASEATGNLTVTAIGNVTQTGVLNIDGQTTVATIGASLIDLDTAGNLFGGTVSLTTGTGAIDLADSDGALDLGTTTTTGALTVSSTGGQVTQSGAINVGNTIITANTAAGSDITLMHINNTFGTLDLTSNGNIAIREAGEIDIAVAGIQTGAGGTLLLQSTVATGTAIEQAGAITAGDTTLIAVGTNKNITLTSATNVFGTLSITGNNVSIVENAAVVLGASTISGTLGVNSTNNNITDLGTVLVPVDVKVTGTTTLNAGTGAITLDSPNSTFGTLVLTAASASVTDNSPVDLGAVTLTGNLIILHGGNVTDSGVVDVGGTTSITPILPDPGSAAITLDSGAILDGAVTLTGTSISLTNNSPTGTVVSQIAATGTLTINSTAGNITSAGGSITAVGLAILNASNDPDLSDGFGAGMRFDILIGGSGTNFNIVRLYGDDANLSGESDDLNLGESNLTGNLTVVTVAGFVSQGAITDSGTLTISGTVNLLAGDDGNIPAQGQANITLDQPGSQFGAAVTTDLILNGANIYVKDNSAVELGDVRASGSLTIVSSLADNITQTAATGVVTTNAAFAALFNAGAGNVILANAGPNDFAGAFSGIGGLVNIQE